MEKTLEAGMIGPGQILLILFVIAFIAFWIKTIIEISGSQFSDDSRTTWLVVVVLFGGLGLLIYYLVGRKNRVLATDDYHDVIDDL